MTHRERILAALGHQASDRVALDLGSTIATTMTAQAHARLVGHLGLPAESPPVTVARRSSTVIPYEAILRRFDVDARPVLLGGPDTRPDRNISEDAFQDEWNVTWTRAKDGHFINTDGPFYRLDEPTLQDVEKFPWPDPQDAGRYRGLRERARTLHEETDYAVILSLPVGPVHQCQFVRGYGAWLEDLLLHPAFAEGLLARITEIWVDIAHRALAEAGDFVDVVMYGDDIAIQKTTLFRPALYRRLIKPQHRKMAEAVRLYGKPILYHSCGAVYTFVPDLIELGIAALNPVQVSAADMEPRRLKREFGRDLTFWGAIDTHRVLPTGTPDQVRQEVERRIEELGAGGGYVLCAVHNIQPEVPPENVVAMYDAAREYRG